MIAIILNSGVGSRLGEFTQDKTKCMVTIKEDTSILKYQLSLLKEAGIEKIIVTTGYRRELLEYYINSIADNLSITCVYNAEYQTTNYIKSLDLINCIDEDVILLHGDLIFDKELLNYTIDSKKSCIIIDQSKELPEKDFKAKKQGDYIVAIGIQYFGKDCVAAQPMYKLLKDDWRRWKESINNFCNNGVDHVYAEEAFNQMPNQIELVGIDAHGLLCSEIDTVEDLIRIRNILKKDEEEHE